MQGTAPCILQLFTLLIGIEIHPFTRWDLKQSQGACGVLVSSGMELIFCVEVCMVQSFGFQMKVVVIIEPCFGHC